MTRFPFSTPLHVYVVLFLVVVTLPCKALAERKPIVVATTGMIADVAQEVIGSAVTVRSLIAPGVDPHLYKPTRNDIASILSADLVLYNGLYLEGKMIDALKRAAKSGKLVVAVAEEVSQDELIATDSFSGQFDPHLWMDPLTWRDVAKAISKSLATVLPEQAEQIRKNTDDYCERLDALHRYSTKVINTIPSEHHILVTAHDAFNYFGRRYGFTVVGIQGLSTESEAGVKDIERIVELLVSKKVPAVFIESTVSEKNIRALLEGARFQGHTVSIGGSLFSDAMGASGTYEGTYIGMIDHNVTTIVRALGGDAPEAGFQSKLAGGK